MRGYFTGSSIGGSRLSRLIPRLKLTRLSIQPDNPAPLASRVGSSQVDLPEAFGSPEDPRRDNAASGTSG